MIVTVPDLEKIMKFKRLYSILGVAAVVAVAGSCGTDQAPLGPSAPDSIGSPDYLFGWLLKPTGLLNCRELPAARATETIGRRGGVLRVGPHTLYVPPGALDDDVTITAEAPSSKTRHVRFEPHGLQFERSVYLTLDYDGCSTLGLLLPKRIAYTNNLVDILQYLLSFDNLWTRKVTGRIDHFSAYAVSW